MRPGNSIAFRQAKKNRRLGSQMDSSRPRKTLCRFGQVPNRKATLASPGSSLLPLPKTTWQSEEEGDSELPAAAHLHSCDYCPWGYFGNEGSEVDLYTFAALHIEIPKFGKGLRAATKPSALKNPKRSTRKVDQNELTCERRCRLLANSFREWSDPRTCTRTHVGPKAPTTVEEIGRSIFTRAAVGSEPSHNLLSIRPMVKMEQ